MASSTHPVLLAPGAHPPLADQLRPLGAAELRARLSALSATHTSATGAAPRQASKRRRATGCGQHDEGTGANGHSLAGAGGDAAAPPGPSSVPAVPPPAGLGGGREPERPGQDTTGALLALLVEAHRKLWAAKPPAAQPPLATPQTLRHSAAVAADARGTTAAGAASADGATASSAAAVPPACAHLRALKHLPAAGTAVCPDLLAALLHELRATDWPEKRQRAALHSSAYMTLTRPPALEPGKQLNSKARKAARKFEQHRSLWNLASQVVDRVDSSFASRFTSLAVTKNFCGSPHIDQYDVTHQYTLSLGPFQDGGHLCVESSPSEVTTIDTRGRVVKVDGRFPHWVSGFRGTRFSLVWYCVAGEATPATVAVPTDEPS